jgi:hypothetical protein
MYQLDFGWIISGEFCLSSTTQKITEKEEKLGFCSSVCPRFFEFDIKRGFLTSPEKGGTKGMRKTEPNGRRHEDEEEEDATEK